MFSRQFCVRACWRFLVNSRLNWQWQKIFVRSRENLSCLIDTKAWNVFSFNSNLTTNPTVYNSCLSQGHKKCDILAMFFFGFIYYWRLWMRELICKFFSTAVKIAWHTKRLAHNFRFFHCVAWRGSIRRKPSYLLNDISFI